MPSPTKPPDVAPPLLFSTLDEWAQWLAQHHHQSTGIWMRIAKKGALEPSITYAVALEEALCHGWIDGPKKAVDAHYWLQRFTPRGARSIWSKINRDKVDGLIAAKRMRTAGQAEIDRAKNDGRWDAAYDGAATATVPPDLQAALAANPPAQAFFATLKGANRYAVLFRVQTAKKPETRARRIAQFVEMLARQETLH